MGAREKIALFNMIGAELTGARVLDAFAGSGALGIEALSRGATEVVFIEKNPRVAAVIRDNLRRLDLAEQGSVVVKSVKNCCHDNNFAKKPAGSGAGATEVEQKKTEKADLGQFAVILADPPYDKFDATEVEQLLQFLAPGGVLVLSHPGDAPELTGVEQGKTHHFAAANLTVYRKN